MIYLKEPYCKRQIKKSVVTKYLYFFKFLQDGRKQRKTDSLLNLTACSKSLPKKIVCDLMIILIYKGPFIY